MTNQVIPDEIRRQLGVAPPVTTDNRRRWMWGIASVVMILWTVFWAIAPLEAKMSLLGTITWETFALLMFWGAGAVLFTRVYVASDERAGRRIQLSRTAEGPQITINMAGKVEWIGIGLCGISLAFAVEGTLAARAAGQDGLAVAVGILALLMFLLLLDVVRGAFYPHRLVVSARGIRYERVGITRYVDWGDIARLGEQEQVTGTYAKTVNRWITLQLASPSPSFAVTSRRRVTLARGRSQSARTILIPELVLDRPRRLLAQMTVLWRLAPQSRAAYIDADTTLPFLARSENDPTWADGQSVLSDPWSLER